MLIVFIYVALLSYNVEYLTLPMGSVECIVDEAANIAVVDGRGRLKGRNKDKGSRMDLRASKSNGNMNGGAGWMMNGNGNGNSGNGQRGAGKEKVQWRNLWNEGTDAVMDIPIGGVCEVLYGEGRDPNTDPD